MADRGQRTTIIIEGAEAEVALIKASAKPREAKYDTRRVLVGGAPATAPADPLFAPGGEVAGGAVLYDPEEEPTGASLRTDPLGDDPGAEGGAPDAPWPAAAPAEAPPAAPDTEMRHGVELEDGTFVDLTDELEAIDGRTKLVGMRIVRTTASTNVPRHKVRDCHYVAPAGEGAPLFLAHLWAGLRQTRRAALVRWTKQKNQALGALVARGSEHGHAWLEVLELEWEVNVREVPPRCHLPVARVPLRGREAAARAMGAMSAGVRVFDELRDERTGQRADLLVAARAGARWEPPPEEEGPEDAARLADALAGR